jgi:hypothetical protein
LRIPLPREKEHPHSFLPARFFVPRKKFLYGRWQVSDDGVLNSRSGEGKEDHRMSGGNDSRSKHRSVLLRGMLTTALSVWFFREEERNPAKLSAGPASLS